MWRRIRVAYNWEFRPAGELCWNLALHFRNEILLLVKRFPILSQREMRPQKLMSDLSAARGFGLTFLAGWRTRREHPLAGGKRPQNHLNEKTCKGTFGWDRIEDFAPPENFVGIWLCTSGMKLCYSWKGLHFKTKRKLRLQRCTSYWSVASELCLTFMASFEANTLIWRN